MLSWYWWKRKVVNSHVIFYIQFTRAKVNNKWILVDIYLTVPKVLSYSDVFATFYILFSFRLFSFCALHFWLVIIFSKQKKILLAVMLRKKKLYTVIKNFKRTMSLLKLTISAKNSKLCPRISWRIFCRDLSFNQLKYLPEGSFSHIPIVVKL